MSTERVEHCPKCGAAPKVTAAGFWRAIWACNAGETYGGSDGKAVYFSDSFDCMRRQIEQRDAEIARLRECVRVRDGVIDRWAYTSAEIDLAYAAARRNHPLEAP